MNKAALLLLLAVVGILSEPLYTEMYVTSYGYDDNDPPSAQIAYPKNAGYPTLHNLATETKGMYDDPITFASDKEELRIGIRIYVPFLRKYFIMEDDCAECDSDWESRRKYHVDLWMGPQSASNSNDLNNCEDKITRSSAQVIISPPSNLPVDTTPLFTNNQCTARIYPEDLD
eukprot:TRINITY_DN1042_c0_g2_i1.p1 TRINITY_DN1042_c0_g2~~TRINITY_DN1042_c0_g2_i1.p1  ORF type:complete len:195 (-),score=43.46 TRINITY_DN1042_c0_g2_i1:36-554(-)